MKYLGPFLICLGLFGLVVNLTRPNPEGPSDRQRIRALEDRVLKLEALTQ